MALYIYEFLYRGQPQSASQPPAWHLILASDQVDELGRLPEPGQAMTLDEAKKLGWNLPKIIEAINGEALLECEALRVALSEREQALEAAEDARRKAEIARADVEAAQIDTVSELNKVRAEREALQAASAALQKAAAETAETKPA